MKKPFVLLIPLFFLFAYFNVSAQDGPVSPAMVSKAIYHDVYGPLSDIPALTGEELEALMEDDKKERNKELKERYYPFAATAQPQGPDPAWQKEMGNVSGNRDLIKNFSGQSTTINPPDCNGTIGPDHYMQTINMTYAIYNRDGVLLAGPTALNSLFSGVPGSSNNDGDPVILYDEQAGRWLVAEFSGVYTNPDYMLIAVSQTDDPTGLWDRWSFVMNGFPDYMKFGIWRDGYYMGTNTTSGDDIYVFERSAMLNGAGSPKMVQFNNPWRPGSGFHCVLPVDNDGVFAPLGSPGMFITINDDAWGGSQQDQLWIYELDVDWVNTLNSTFNRVQTLNVAAFDANFGSTWDNIVQPGTTQKLDAISQILMHRAQYRNFSTSQRIVCNHTVDVNGTDRAGIRWYELEYSGTEWEVRQYGTYSPDSDSRWMGSIAINEDQEIALGYSVSSSTTYPSIRYTGQTASENALATGILNVSETSVQAGTSSQTSSNRWGDYSNMAVDPADGNTFWFTTEYAISGAQKGTRIAAFQMPQAPLADFAADNISPTVEDTVSFTDLSTNNPFFWSWTFTPSTVTFLDGTSATSQNPKVRFDEAGAYTVELTATNSVGSGTEVKTDYIYSYDIFSVLATAEPGVICEKDTSQLNAQVTGGSGSYTYSWTSDPEGFTSNLPDPKVAPEVTTVYEVIVSDGELSDTSRVEVAVNPLPEIVLGEWPEYLCNTDDPVQLTAEPEGGTYSGPATAPEGLFSPAQANLGWNIIFYNYIDPNNCEAYAMDSIFVDNCTGIGQVARNNDFVKIFPNPNSGDFTVESVYFISKLEMIDQQTRIIFSQDINKRSASVSAPVTRGIYYIRIFLLDQKSEDIVVSDKVVVY